jgi:hypothetical protein
VKDKQELRERFAWKKFGRVFEIFHSFFQENFLFSFLD